MCYRFISIFIVTLLLSSCSSPEPNITSNLRLLTTGRIVDENLNALEGIFVEIELDNFNGTDLEIAQGFSDANGEFSLTTLYGENDIFLVKIINNEGFSRYSYSVITEDYEPENLVFDLGEIQLKRLSSFQLNVINSSLENNTLEVEVNYEQPNCDVFYEGDTFIESNCFPPTSRVYQITENNIDFERRLFVPLSSTVEIVYTINGGDQITEQILINDTEVNYEINF